MKRIIAPLLILPLLTACAGPVGGTKASTMYNRHQCRDLDWNMAGIADGIQGYADVEKRFTALSENCVKHGVTADQEGYLAGYEEGRRRAGEG